MSRLENAMEKFTQAYDQTRKLVVTEKTYPKSWQSFLSKKVSPLLASDGPNSTHAAGLDALREKLDETAQKRTTGTPRERLAAAIYDASANSKEPGDLARRAAGLKMLKHLYWAQKKGAQSVWVYAPPKKYTKWVFDEITGSKGRIKRRLCYNRDIYTSAQRKVMCTALAQATRSAQRTANLLGTPTKKTTTVFKRWFDDGNIKSKDMTKKMTEMSQVFLRIATLLGSNKLVLSDEPLDRASGGWKDWGFVYSGASRERLDVVYIQKAFLDAGNSGQVWRCVLTLVHELSHRVLNTEDYRYDDGSPGDVAGKGLKPGGTFDFAHASTNADSLAYFCVDLMGMLSTADRNSALAGTL